MIAPFELQMTRRVRGRSAAFTILEAAIASTLLVILVSSVAVAMIQINRWAAAARLQTIALAVAQQKVDEVLAVPWLIRSPRPPVLTAGTVTENNLALNNDAFNSQTALSSLFTDLDTPVTATRVTQITDLPPRSVRASVTVTFTYRQHTYRSQLTTLRVTDDI